MGMDTQQQLRLQDRFLSVLYPFGDLDVLTSGLRQRGFVINHASNLAIIVTKTSETNHNSRDAFSVDAVSLDVDIRIDQAQIEIRPGWDYIYSIFYAHSKWGLVVGTEIKEVASIAGQPVHLDDRYIAMYLSGGPIGRATMSPIYGINRIPRNSYMTIKSDKSVEITTHPWQSRRRSVDASNLSAVTRQMVAANIERALRARTPGPVAVALSGGLDSSAVSSACRDVVSDRIAAFTLVFERDTSADEREFAVAVATQFHLDLIEIPGDDLWMLKDFENTPWFDEPLSTTLNWKRQEAMLDAAARAGVTAFFTGFGGDQLMTLGTRRFVRSLSYRAAFGAESYPIEWAGSRLKGQGLDSVAYTLDDNSSVTWDSEHHVICRYAAKFGIGVFHPLFSRDLCELYLTTPRDWKGYGGNNKRAFRESFGLPPLVANRNFKSGGSYALLKGLQAEWPKLSKQLIRTPFYEFIDERAFGQHMERLRQGVAESTAQTIRGLGFALWLLGLE